MPPNLALHGSSDATSKEAEHMTRKMELKSNSLDSIEDEKVLEERPGYGREVDKRPDYATSLAPTLGEKTLKEHRPQQSQADDGKLILNVLAEDHAKYNQNGSAQPGEHATEIGEVVDMPAEPRVCDDAVDVYGMPADASKNFQADNQPPYVRLGKNDFIDAEKATVRGRSILRTHLSPRIGGKPWTLPVPGPIVNPHGFEDPICDEFYKDVWVAAAVHNVRSYLFISRKH